MLHTIGIPRPEDAEQTHRRTCGFCRETVEMVPRRPGVTYAWCCPNCFTRYDRRDVVDAQPVPEPEPEPEFEIDVSMLLED